MFNLDIKARLRNKYFLTGLVSLIVLIVQTFTPYRFPENFQTIVDKAIILGTLLGLVVDGSTPGFQDKPSE